MDMFFEVLMTVILATVAVFLIIYVITAIGEFHMFKKAGIPGWHAFVPFLNTYDLCSLARMPDFFKWFLVLTISTSFVSNIINNLANISEGVAIISFISLLLSIAQIWWIAVVYKRVAESFGYYSWGWVILMMFFSPIIFIIMGFNDSKYEMPSYELTMKQYIDFLLRR